MKTVTFARRIVTAACTSVVLAAIAAGPLMAQRVARNVGPTRLVLYGGASIATMTGAGVYPQASHTGFDGGLVAILPFTENFSLRTGIAYVQKGLQDSLPLASGFYNIGYVEFPFIFRMAALPGEDVSLHALAGFILGFRSSCAFRVDSIGAGTVYNGACGQALRARTFATNGTDNSAVFGLNLSLLASHTVSYEINGTYEIGLNEVDPEVNPYIARNRSVGITAGIVYAFR